MKLANSLFKLGTENAFVVLAKAKALEAQGKEIINLGIGQPDFRTPKHIVDAAKKALDDGFHGYTPAKQILPPTQRADDGACGGGDNQRSQCRCCCKQVVTNILRCGVYRRQRSCGVRCVPTPQCVGRGA